jgi:NAD(P) transhydrogenase subunit beta
MSPVAIHLGYLFAASLFILGLRELSSPRTAVRGNLLGALGMFLAVVLTLTDHRILRFEIILGGLVLGSIIGAVLAKKIRMTAMPQLVALLNGLGGGASTLVAGTALVDPEIHQGALAAQISTATVGSGVIGTITFWGSLVAFAKLQELMPENAVRFPGQHLLNGLLMLTALGLGIGIVQDPGAVNLYWIMVVVASVLGVLMVLPVGGADMPVAIAFLNALSGLAAAATGFVLANNILIITGSLVGASGLILTQIMCNAMNRSMIHVFSGALATGEETGMDADQVYKGRVKSSSPEEVAMLLDAARRVVVVPGYGLAVSQAQHAVSDLATILESRGVEVEFGIHPVAGRMPGHMNVLLAEAEIPYDRLKEMDEINSTFERTDVVIVIGANDVVNPVARTDPNSPIAGMPILDVDKARTVVVIKRSLSPGFAGIPNPLFAADNTMMLFGDGRKAVQDLIMALKRS